MVEEVYSAAGDPPTFKNKKRRTGAPALISAVGIGGKQYTTYIYVYIEV